MAYLSLSIDAIKPLNRWDYARIQPGPVGSVGDVNCQPRLKHSAPDLPLRYDPNFSHQNEVFLGSNVSDGQYTGYDGGGGPANTVDSNWVNKKFKTNHGWIYQDMRAPDTLHEPENTGIPQYSWHNKLATAYDAFRTGNAFMPVTGAYAQSPGEVTRGGDIPRIVGVEQREKGTDLTSENIFRTSQARDESGGRQGRRLR